MNSTITCAALGEELHCLSLDESGRICHRVLFANGNWTAWDKLPDKGFESVAAAGMGDELHIMCTTKKRVVFHNIRAPDSKWQGFAQVPDRPSTGPA